MDTIFPEAEYLKNVYIPLPTNGYKSESELEYLKNIHIPKSIDGDV